MIMSDEVSNIFYAMKRVYNDMKSDILFKKNPFITENKILCSVIHIIFTNDYKISSENLPLKMIYELKPDTLVSKVSSSQVFLLWISSPWDETKEKLFLEIFSIDKIFDSFKEEFPTETFKFVQFEINKETIASKICQTYYDAQIKYDIDCKKSVAQYEREKFDKEENDKWSDFKNYGFGSFSG